MTVVVLQPSYIPWRGYFHQIQKSDIFVFYDCVQYDKNGWRNRNKIKTSQGEKWLTIPVSKKGSYDEGRKIKDIPIKWDQPWSKKHKKSLAQNYSKAPFFKYYRNLTEQIFNRHDAMLADFTSATTEIIARELGIIKTRFLRSSELELDGSKNDRILSILKQLNATHYITGPSAQVYLDKTKFDEAGILVEIIKYNYPEYPQIHGVFNPHVSILDLLFNVGPESHRFIWGK